jgi:hypothetical protein
VFSLPLTRQLWLLELLLDSDGPFTFDSRSGVRVSSGIFKGRVDVLFGGLEVSL